MTASIINGVAALISSGLLQWVAIGVLGLFHVKNAKAIVTASAQTLSSLTDVAHAVGAAAGQSAGHTAAVAVVSATKPSVVLKPLEQQSTAAGS